MAMISENIVRSVLMTVLLILSLGRLFVLVRFPSKWPWHKADLALCFLSCILFTLLTGLFWRNRVPAWDEVLFWVTSVFPPLHAYLRIIFQQREIPNTPRSLRIIYPSFAALSTLAKVAFSLVGTFVLSSVHLGGLFVLSVDYLDIAAWYWWLFRQSTLGRAQLRCTSCYLSVVALLLLVVAIIGILVKRWIFALEVITIIPISPTTLTLGRSSWSLSCYLLCS
ncbi:unnamed protein product [Penicillium salamii]|uniref:Uncharacterized protein n=1 Tax=Penicillium salamii TaxID=1612424 RepID=A0A9W4JXQ9_9EURO|nr:unnamed protein product [Penicillium salamii]CAG7935724.1 unnamed protein product [Penicillium salamii]CAG7947491.1 unnamed protein product [Penicillium salamii]CAG7948359.1 unnamed protein product [Penicillium salamii]CAG7948957.1 unnamed protein product [Penicillium salamii]